VNKREVRERIKQNLTTLSAEVWQECPYTAVKITASIGNDSYEAIGFAKIKWPDVWDAEYGVDLATDKAIAKITRLALMDPGWNAWAKSETPYHENANLDVLNNVSTECAG